jgi:hypothetical protein
MTGEQPQGVLVAGVKGRSGKVSTPEAHEARRNAARMGGLAKAARTAQTDAEGNPFEVATWIDLKDKLNCDLLERKISAADIEVETLAAKRDQERGKLLTIEQVRTRDERKAEIFRSALLGAVDLAAKWVPADRIIVAQADFREWVEATLEKVAAEVRQ